MRTYALVLAALLVLTAVTVAATGVRFASPAVNVVAALGIATLKASLVALYFMHLRHDKPMNALIFTTGLAILATLLGLTLIDVETRLPVQPSSVKAAV
ncbi:MAG: cytochrome-c oxidase [Acidobacteriales bacterium]|nr:MAG: cytochrome-c oxidase [Terriglobales bacterium]